MKKGTSFWEEDILGAPPKRNNTLLGIQESVSNNALINA
jgi:hypothetical protein